MRFRRPSRHHPHPYPQWGGKARQPRESTRTTNGMAPRSSSHQAATANLVLLGEFGRPHGLSGEVRLKSYTADPLAIVGYGPLATSDGRTLTPTDARPAPGGTPDILIVRIEGVADRNAAEALNRVALFCARDRLGDVEDEDEFFAADLVGLDAVDAAGRVIGTVAAVPNYGGGDLLEIRPAAGGATALLPFTRAFVPEIDVAGRRIVVDPPDDLFAAPGPRPADEPA